MIEATNRDRVCEASEPSPRSAKYPCIASDLKKTAERLALRDGSAMRAVSGANLLSGIVGIKS
jgi:hypothetical protein